MDIYVTRHGETEYNHLGLVCGGQTDIALTEAGRAQAQELYNRLCHIPITNILVSPLQRARETASILSNGRIPVHVDTRLREQDFGIYEGAPLTQQEFVDLRKNFAYTIPGGESIFQAAHRVYSLLDEIPAAYPGETLLLVCHGAIARIIHTYFTDMTNEEFYQFTMPNCGLNHYTI
jgi:broad specificity phosphatase PhoE